VIGGERLKEDYGVHFEERIIGRIKFASKRYGHNPGWDWYINPPLPIPTWGSGCADDLEDAKAAFRDAWERFYARLTPDDIKHWHATDRSRQ
jgi:hypothetical protein